MLGLKGTLVMDYSPLHCTEEDADWFLLSWLPGAYFVISAKGTCKQECLAKREWIQKKCQFFPA